MNSRQKADLDRHITGDWGERQFPQTRKVARVLQRKLKCEACNGAGTVPAYFINGEEKDCENDCEACEGWGWVAP